jgi:hypothetical protein
LKAPVKKEPEEVKEEVIQEKKVYKVQIDA